MMTKHTLFIIVAETLLSNYQSNQEKDTTNEIKNN